jgi:hypothetical protein
MATIGAGDKRKLTPTASGRDPMVILDLIMIGTQSDVAQAPLARLPVICPIRTDVVWSPCSRAAVRSYQCV